MDLQARDVAQNLGEHPDFFDRHPELLPAMQLPHPHNGQAISLVERQSLMLRERIKSLELKIAELMRHGRENDAIADKLVHWTRALLLEADAATLPATLVAELKRTFDVPHAALRLWNVRSTDGEPAWAQPVGADTVSLADSMRVPFCGSNVGFEAASWLEEAGASVQSLALLPLRVGADPQTFGLLVLGSADKDRFQVTMGTAFLERIAELASAALARLRA
jgi:uncharacterized protein YigA (DUF484 family)